MVEQRLTQFIDHWAEEVIQFTKDLIAAPSETPPGDERKIGRAHV